MKITLALVGQHRWFHHIRQPLPLVIFGFDRVIQIFGRLVPLDHKAIQDNEGIGDACTSAFPILIIIGVVFAAPLHLLHIVFPRTPPVIIQFGKRQKFGFERQLDDGILADIAPTMLEELYIEKPEAMTGRSLWK